MPKRKTKLPPLKLATQETFGQRLARFRKERGLTQQALADKVGIIQVLVADYERGKLRLNAEMICRFALALDVSADSLLGLKSSAGDKHAKQSALSLKIIRRVQKIENLPPLQQREVLRSIDMLLGGVSQQAS